MRTMSARCLRPLAVLAILVVAAPAARAWSPEMHQHVAEQAACLMPPSLRHVLASNRARLDQGATAPWVAAGAAGPSADCDLDRAVLTQTQRVLDLLSQRGPLSMVAYEMGVLSNLVARAQDPTSGGGEDPDEELWAGNFREFVEKRAPRFRIVFDGYLSESLQRDDVAGFARTLCDRSRRYYPVLASSYHLAGGRIADGSTFDDRHPVFGIGELAYAHAISDTAKLWLYIWVRSNGDTSGLPYPDALVAAPAAAPKGAAR